LSGSSERNKSPSASKKESKERHRPRLTVAQKMTASSSFFFGILADSVCEHFQLFVPALHGIRLPESALKQASLTSHWRLSGQILCRKVSGEKKKKCSKSRNERGYFRPSGFFKDIDRNAVNATSTRRLAGISDIVMLTAPQPDRAQSQTWKSLICLLRCNIRNRNQIKTAQSEVEKAQLGAEKMFNSMTIAPKSPFCSLLTESY
jgi:hypothetical protein